MSASCVSELVESPVLLRRSGNRSTRGRGGHCVCVRIGWAVQLIVGIAAVLGAMSACASAGAASGATSGVLGNRVSDAARWHLAKRPGLQRRDCSGLVSAILGRAGAADQGNTKTYWQDASRDGRVTDDPSPGDLAFFDRTYDANRNGRVDDSLTHIAVVTNIESDGTVVMVHYGSRRIRELRLNLATPAEHRVDGKVVNDYLRSPSYGGADTPRLAGQLLRGFARPPPTRQR